MAAAPAGGKVVVTYGGFALDHPEAGGALRAAGLELVVSPRSADRTPAQLAEVLGDAVAAIADADPFDADVLGAASDLKVIARTGVGLDSIDLEAASREGVVVTTTPGTNHETVADHTLALMLAVLRNLRRLDADVRGGGWRDFSLPLSQLNGATVGLVGYGAIGQAVGRRVKAFGAKLLVHDPVGAPAGEELVDLDDLLRRSQVVVAAPAAGAGDDEADRRAPARPAAPGRRPRQHLARADRRPGGAGRGAPLRPPRRRRARRLRGRAARPRPPQRLRQRGDVAALRRDQRRVEPGDVADGDQERAVDPRRSPARGDRQPRRARGDPVRQAMDDATYEEFKKGIFARMWSDVAPFVTEIEDTETIPREKVWPVLAEIGAFGLLVPEEYGGSELTVRQYLPIIAELAKVHGGIRAAVHVHNSIGHALYELGDERHRAEVLPGARRRGEVGRLRADRARPRDRRRHRDDGRAARATTWVVNGRKWLITNSDFASHFIVFAKTIDGSERSSQHDPGPARRAGAHHRGAAGDDGLQGRRARAADLHRRRRPRRQPARRRRRRDRQDGGGAGDQPRLRRRLLARHRRVRARPLDRTRQAADHLRPADRRPPGGAALPRRDGGRRARAAPDDR